ncbi:MAG: PDZ domain-containing protein [Planctomycetota bacterium]|jgi:S1-C subfamily serine protease
MIRHTLPLLALLLLASPVYAQTDAWLGLKAEVVEEAEAKKLGIAGGLKVTRVDKASPAEKAEIETGDIILNADETAILTVENLKDVLSRKAAGDKLNLSVRRKNGRNEPLMVTLGSKHDKTDEFSNDAKVAELREKIRAKEAEKRTLEKQLEKRIRDLKTGKAKVVAPTQPEEKVDIEPEVVKPKPAKLTVTVGARFKNLTAEQTEKAGIDAGIIVTSVKSGSAAFEAGLKVGDIVIGAGDTDIAGTGDLRSLLATKSAGQTLEFEVRRGKKSVSITVVLRAK